MLFHISTVYNIKNCPVYYGSGIQRMTLKASEKCTLCIKFPPFLLKLLLVHHANVFSLQLVKRQGSSLKE